MPDEAPLVITERSSDGVLLVRLNRPERRNALSTPVLMALVAALNTATADPSVGAVVVTGNETVFAAGADIDELAQASSEDDVESPRFLAWQEIRGFTKPLLAAVEGWCLGAGCELAMCCDIIVAGKDARFGQPETNLAIMPGAGGTVTLPRRIGQQLAMLMVLTGAPITAQDARDCGLIALVTETDQALERALGLATTIAARAPVAIRAAKASIKLATALTEQEHLHREREIYLALLGSADKAEGIRAFKEKRAAVWTGR